MKSRYLWGVVLPLLLLPACNVAQVDGDSVAIQKPASAGFTVREYRPAPGQFVKGTPTLEEVTERLKSGSIVSLGGWGGYIVIGFDESVVDRDGADIAIRGNAFENSSEPGIMYVMEDANGNGEPDDTWIEVPGSETSETDYAVTYHRGDDENPIRWEDNRGGSGVVERNEFHTQDYYPAWIAEDSYTLTGSLLPPNVTEQGGVWLLTPFAWGYADNFGSDYVKNEWILDVAATGVSRVDFVKIQTGIHSTAGWVGEISTEICGVRSL